MLESIWKKNKKYKYNINIKVADCICNKAMDCMEIANNDRTHISLNTVHHPGHWTAQHYLDRIVLIWVREVDRLLYSHPWTTFHQQHHHLAFSELDRPWWHDWEEGQNVCGYRLSDRSKRWKVTGRQEGTLCEKQENSTFLDEEGMKNFTKVTNKDAKGCRSK